MRQRAPQNLAVLHSEELYRRYFALLTRVCLLLQQCYARAEEKQTYESKLMSGYFARFLATVEALRLKFTFRNGGERPLYVDLSDSGLPSWTDIHGLALDAIEREDRVARLAPAAALKQAALDVMLRDQNDPEELLALVSQREFFETLDPDRLLLDFTVGGIRPGSAKVAGRRPYVFDWALYDEALNRPAVHVLSFDQDADADPMDQNGASYQRLVETVRFEGQHAPLVGTLAGMIDDAMESVHPKVLKRLTLGPLFASWFADGDGGAAMSDERRAACAALQRFARSADDFILLFGDEVVVSERQVINRGVFSLREKVREIFLIPETDAECYRSRASVVHRYVLLPHRVLQEIGSQAEDIIPGIGRMIIISYDEGGGITIHGQRSSTD